MRTMAIVCSCALFAFLGAIISCGGDDDDDPAVEADLDSTTVAVQAAEAVMFEAVSSVAIGPMEEEEEGNKDFECSQTNDGTCPTVTVECEVGVAVSVVTVWAEEDSCTDSESGAPVSGSIIFTRNGLRDWTVELEDFRRGDFTFDGSVVFEKSGVGEPWTVSISDLDVSGAIDVENTHSDCSSDCVSSTAFDGTFTVTVSTDSLSIDVDIVGSQTFTVDGSVSVSGNVTGTTTIVAKNRRGEDLPPQSAEVDRDFDGTSMTFAGITYGLPPSCTCPSTGSITSSGSPSCGAMTVVFSASSGDPCSIADVSYTESSIRCDNTAVANELLLEEYCVSVDLNL